MWKKESPIPRKGHLPFRGQSEPKFLRSSERRYRNLDAEKREGIATVSVLVTIGILFVIAAIYFYNPYSDNLAFGALLIGAFFFFIFAIGMTSAIKNIYKFRQGHDVDTSMMDEENDEKQDKGDD